MHLRGRAPIPREIERHAEAEPRPPVVRIRRDGAAQRLDRGPRGVRVEHRLEQLEPTLRLERLHEHRLLEHGERLFFAAGLVEHEPQVLPGLPVLRRERDGGPQRLRRLVVAAQLREAHADVVLRARERPRDVLRAPEERDGLPRLAQRRQRRAEVQERVELLRRHIEDGPVHGHRRFEIAAPVLLQRRVELLLQGRGERGGRAGLRGGAALLHVPHVAACRAAGSRLKRAG